MVDRMLKCELFTESAQCVQCDVLPVSVQNFSVIY